MINKEFDAKQDIFYSSDYISLYLKDEDELFEFEYNDGNKIFLNKSIKRPIRKIGNLLMNDGFYDLETAYGYGGFYINTTDEYFINKAFNEYQKKCKKEKIIAEFIRFHPFNDFPNNYYNFLDFNYYDRDTVMVNVNQKYENTRNGFSSSLKRNIKKAQKNGLQYKKLAKNEQELTKFYTLYLDTMKKNDADNFYFFDKKYFEDLFKINNVELHSITYDGHIINMIIIFISNDILYYHLGATDQRYYSLNPNPLLFDNIIKNAELKYDYLYLGGGTTSNSDDPLLKFKQKFSSETKPFYISGKIYNKEIYDKYNLLWEQQSSYKVKYFLKYRLEV